MSNLQVEPGEISFDEVKPEVLYVMTFSVRNLGSMAQRIRLQAPKSSFFALNYIPTGSIAPGLDLRAEIEFQIPSCVGLADLVFRDLVIATMGANDRVEIPLRAVRPHPVVKFESIVNLGNVLLNQPLTRDVAFENVSALPTIVTLNAPKDAFMQISATKLELKAAGCEQSRAVVKLQVVPRSLGPLRELVKVTHLACYLSTMLQHSI
jgi:hypothetical protein